VNLVVIAVLNGSISNEAPVASMCVITNVSTTAAAMYLPIHKRFSSATGGSHFGTRSALESCPSTSCRAPNGHSQPQNTPRPINTTEMSV
jgi:hypothetical protein